MKKIAIVALAAAATFITSCDIERMPYDKYTAVSYTHLTLPTT